MCGLVGILPRHQGRDRLCGQIERALLTLKHRGPDGQGMWVDREGKVGLGHQRLAILDLSRRAAQPMESHNRRYVIAYNGEIYNFQELRTSLAKEGYPFDFRSNSDTEVVLSALSWWGLRDALSRFRGMFALFLWDREEKHAVLARDSIGIKPLYYGMTGAGFVAASEVRAFRDLPGFNCRIDRRAVSLFLQYGYIPAPFSILEGIRKLNPGTYLTVGSIDVGGCIPEPEPFLTVDQVIKKAQGESFRGTFDEAVGAVSEAVGTAVGRHLVSDVPLGLLLSGGIDSTLVASEMAAAGRCKQHSFTIGFPGWEEGDEGTYAEQVACHLGMTHTSLEVSPQVALDAVADLATVYDEPFADPSALPTVLVCRLAGQEVTVGLSGDGGDELFFGYQRYPDVLKRVQQMQALARAGGRGLAGLAGLASRAYRLVVEPFLDRTGRRYRDIEGVRRSLVDPSIGVVYPRAMQVCIPEAWLADVDPASELGVPSDIAGLSDSRWMMRNDLHSYLPDDILVKVDRASMWFGLEMRPPLLDIDLLKLSWSLPDRYLCDERGGKRILREILYKRVPRELMDRRKRGFGPPIGIWMRGELRDWVETALSESSLRDQGLLNVRAVRRRWRAHLEGRADWTYQLWTAVMLQEWLRSN